MPRRRKSLRTDADESGHEYSEPEQSSNITMPQDVLAKLLTSIQQSQAEFCQQLLREVQDSLKESQNGRPCLKPSSHSEDRSNVAASAEPARVRTYTSSTASRSSAVVASGRMGDSATEKTGTTKVFCVYCKRSGHTKETCEKLVKNSDQNKSKSDFKKDIKCYGCGAANIIKSKCPKCNANNVKNNGHSAFYSLTSARDSRAPTDCFRSHRTPRVRSDVRSGSDGSAPRPHHAPTPLPRSSVMFGGTAGAPTCPSVERHASSLHSVRGNPAAVRGAGICVTNSRTDCNSFNENSFCIDNRNRSVLRKNCIRLCTKTNVCVCTKNVKCVCTKNVKCVCTKNLKCVYTVCDQGEAALPLYSSVSTSRSVSFNGCQSHPGIPDGSKSCARDFMPVTCDYKPFDNNISDSQHFSQIASGSQPFSENVSASQHFLSKNDNCQRLCGIASGGQPLNGNRDFRSFLRPVLNISILGENGTALLDSAAKSCVAGHTLYALLKAKGHPMSSGMENVKLADGVLRLMNVLTTEVNVTLEGRTRLVRFLIFPESDDNESLLGIDFLINFNICVDFGNFKWHFFDSVEQFDLPFEKVLHQADSVPVSSLLRDEEASRLSDAQREVLAQFLSENKDVFELRGEPTAFAEHAIDTGDHAPVAVPPYRLTPAKKAIM
ncbi:hypothetical protein HF086_007684, partial [Spodoptera exigua]